MVPISVFKTRLSVNANFFDTYMEFIRIFKTRLSVNEVIFDTYMESIRIFKTRLSVNGSFWRDLRSL